jgi:hypothetical protein
VTDQLELVNTDRNREVVLERLRELGLTIRQVRFVEARDPARSRPAPDSSGSTPPHPESPQAPPSPTPAPLTKPRTHPVQPVLLDKASFENDPLIKKALELFRGQIVEIRP